MAGSETDDETVRVPMLAEAILEETKVVDEVKMNVPEAVKVLPESDNNGVPVTELILS